MAPKLHKSVITETYDIVAHGISRWSAKIEISGSEKKREQSEQKMGHLFKRCIWLEKEDVCDCWFDHQDPDKSLLYPQIVSVERELNLTSFLLPSFENNYIQPSQWWYDAVVWISVGLKKKRDFSDLGNHRTVTFLMGVGHRKNWEEKVEPRLNNR